MTRARAGALRRRRAALVGIALALLAAVPFVTAAPAAAVTCSTGKGTSPTSGLVKEAHPVVLVHGWDGAPMQPTRVLLEKRLPSGWQFLLYDYSAVHAHWAARPEVAACLAQYLHAVSLAHRAAGGDGRVYVVAHSMGGLATSNAVDVRYGGVPSLADEIGGLTTIDTPWTGSTWGDTPYSWVAQALSNWHWPDASSDAWSCLRTLGTRAAGGCSEPAFMPKRVPVAQLAGDVTISRSFFHLHAYDISLGSDAIVGDDSQHGYLESAPGDHLGLHTTIPTVKCTEDFDSVLAQGGARLGAQARGTVGQIIGGLAGTELQLLLDGKAMDALGTDRASWALAELLGRTLAVSSCSHLGMPTNGRAVDEVVAALTAQARPQQLQPTDLLNAPVPAYCQHPAGRLVSGTQPLRRDPNGADVGYATVLATGTKKFRIAPVLTELGGGPPQELAGVLSCSAGGVSWPDLVLVYRSGVDGPELAGSLGLGDVTRYEHGDVVSLKAGAAGPVLTWRSYEGCCSLLKTWSATLRLTGGKLVAADLRQLSGVTSDEPLSMASTIGPAGVGPVQLGMTTAEVKDAVGPALDFSPAGAGYCDSFDHGGLQVLLPGSPVHRVEQVTIRPGGMFAGITTAEGIGLGSTVAQVRAAYPGATYVATGFQQGEPYYLVRSGARGLLFLVSGTKVVGLVAASASALQSDELCA